MTATSAPAPPTRSTKLLVASTLVWLAGIVEILIAFAVGFPQYAKGFGFPTVFVAEGVLGVLLCIAGFELRKRRKVGGVIAAVAVTASVLNHVLAGTLMSVGTGITLVALVLVVSTWRELQ